MPDYRLSLEFTAPDDEHARKRADDIADNAAVEYGTRSPVALALPPMPLPPTIAALDAPSGADSPASDRTGDPRHTDVTQEATGTQEAS